MSIQSNFPAISPTLLLDFANVEQLDPRITFARASTATYYGTQTAKAEENLLLQSQALATTWVNNGTTDTADTEVAPDGTTTADTLTATAVASFHIITQTSASTTGTTRTFSLFAKKGTHNFVQLYFNADTNVFANFDLNAGTVGTVGSASTGTITSVGSGWYRCVMTTSSATANNVAAIAMITSGTAARTESWTALGTETIFLWGAQLEQRSAVTAYTPTTTQTITNYIPVLETAASGVARFDHNPTTFESLGLLIEESRTNLVTYSEQFDNAAWSKTNSTITANTIVAPDGALTGDKLVEDTANSTHFVQRNATVTFTAAANTFSVYLKAGERTWTRLTLLDGVSTFGAYFNLSTGAIGATSGGATATATPVGNGWYRCSITATTAATASGSARILLANADNGQTYTGDGYSGIYIWGAQLEVGAFATSYIPTVASQVTRAADVALMTGTNFSSWYNAAQGSLYAEWSSVGSLSDNRIPYAISDGTFNNVNYLTAATASASNQSVYTIRSSNTTQANMAVSVAYTNYAYRKTAAAYKVNDFALSGDGGAVAVDTSGSVPIGIDRLSLGTSWTANSNFLNGTIRKIAYYPVRIQNSQLQGLTS